jgi:hypothetical protein
MKGYVKNTVYADIIHDLYHLQNRIYTFVAIITLKTVHCTLNEIEYSLMFVGLYTLLIMELTTHVRTLILQILKKALCFV